MEKVQLKPFLWMMKYKKYVRDMNSLFRMCTFVSLVFVYYCLGIFDGIFLYLVLLVVFLSESFVVL